MKGSSAPAWPTRDSSSRRTGRSPSTGAWRISRRSIFHTLLGTSYEKVMRFRKLAAWIADRIDPVLTEPGWRGQRRSPRPIWTRRWSANSRSCRGSWDVNMRFWTARIPSWPRPSTSIIFPRRQAANFPKPTKGAIVSIADKMDTICGFFGVGLIPTGTADPYALRRQALGVINIILKKRYPLSLDALIDESLAILGPAAEAPRR